MDQKAIADAGFDKGLAKGIEKGIATGKKEGRKDKAVEIAKKMKNKGILLEEIEEITGLSKEEIEKL